MGVNSVLSIQDGDAGLDGLQIFDGQIQTITLTATAAGENLKFSTVSFNNQNLYYYDPLDPDNTLVVLPLSLTWTYVGTGLLDDGDTIWEANESRIWTASYTIPPMPLGYEAVFETTINVKDFAIPVNQTESSGATVSGISVVDEPNPSLTLTKTADKSIYESEGELITYTFLVDNTGNRDLTNVTVSDSMLAGGSATSVLGTEDNPATTTWDESQFNIGDVDGDATLDTNEVWTFTGQYLTTSADNAAGFVYNFAQATAYYGQTVVSGEDWVTVVYDPPFIPNPALILTKIADKTSFNGAGETINYSFAVTNSGNVTLADLTLTDDLIDNETAVLGGEDNGATAWNETLFNIGDSNGDGFFDVGETWQFTGSYTTTTANQSDILNTATATASYGGEDYSDTDSWNVDFISNPSLALTKTANKSTFNGAGQVITYSFDVYNDGNVDLSQVRLNDPLISDEAPVNKTGTSFNAGDADNDGVLDVGETWKYTGSYTTTKANQSDILNTATATASYGGEDYSDTDSWNVDFISNPSLALTKTANRTEFSGAGQVINYTFDVVNNGNVDLSQLTLDDPFINNEAAVNKAGTTFNTGDADNDGILDVGETWKYTGSYTTTSADTSTIVNVATATAFYGEDAVSDTDDAIVTYNPPKLEGLSQGYWGQHITGRKADPTWNFDADPITSGTQAFRTADFETFFGLGTSLTWGRNVQAVTTATAVNLSGGGQNALARDAVAAILNSTRADIYYKYTTSQIVSMVQDAFNMGINASANQWTMNSLQAELNANNSLGLQPDPIG